MNRINSTDKEIAIEAELHPVPAALSDDNLLQISDSCNLTFLSCDGHRESPFVEGHDITSNVLAFARAILPASQPAVVPASVGTIGHTHTPSAEIFDACAGVAFAAHIAAQPPAGELPVLPECTDELAEADGFNVIGTVEVFTADQMREYGRLCATRQPAPVADDLAVAQADYNYDAGSIAAVSEPQGNITDLDKAKRHITHLRRALTLAKRDLRELPTARTLLENVAGCGADTLVSDLTKLGIEHQSMADVLHRIRAFLNGGAK